ncbi:MAG: AAA-like domain-containing protein [Nitrospiraceae bacterium]|nr:AAA-like domain-containing protein [Nitrospiraceae bacterium]
MEGKIANLTSMKNLQGPVLIRTSGETTMQKVFISYRAKEPDSILASRFYDELKEAEHKPFLASESIRWGEDWTERILTELETCDYFLLLLSEQSLQSEMVAGEVRKAKELRAARKNGKPVILPLRVNLPSDASMNYELKSYLHQTQYLKWNSEADTSGILKRLFRLLEEGAELPPSDESDESTVITATPHADVLPTPSAPLEFPSGQVDLDSPYYVNRGSDGSSYRAVLKQGALIRIKAPRQFGKTSLLSRLLRHADQNGCSIVSLSLQQVDLGALSDLRQITRSIMCLCVTKT